MIIVVQVSFYSDFQVLEWYCSMTILDSDEKLTLYLNKQH